MLPRPLEKASRRRARRLLWSITLIACFTSPAKRSVHISSIRHAPIQTTLGHGHNSSVIPNVQNTILLEDRTQHVLHNHRRSRVADEAGLFIELLGEEINTQVAVLTSLSRGGNTDDLAWTSLQDYNITNADEMARDGDSPGNATTATVVIAVGHLLIVLTLGTRPNTDFAILDSDVFLYDTIVVVMMMVVTAAVDRVQDAVSGAVEALTERVVLALVVVVSHITAVLAFGSVYSTLFGYLDFFVNDFAVALCSFESARIGALVLPAAGLSVFFCEWDGAVTIVTLSDIDAGVKIYLGCWSVTRGVLAVLDVDLGVDVALIWLTVAVVKPVILAAVTWV